MLLLAERWLKSLPDLGRAQATFAALPQRPPPLFCILQPHSIESVNALFEDLAAYISYPACLIPRQAPSSCFACWQSASGMTFSCIWASARSIRPPICDRVMLVLTYYSTLRRSEIISLRVDDFDAAHRLIRIGPGSGRAASILDL